MSLWIPSMHGGMFWDILLYQKNNNMLSSLGMIRTWEWQINALCCRFFDRHTQAIFCTPADEVYDPDMSERPCHIPPCNSNLLGWQHSWLNSCNISPFIDLLHTWVSFEKYFKFHKCFGCTRVKSCREAAAWPGGYLRTVTRPDSSCHQMI